MYKNGGYYVFLDNVWNLLTKIHKSKNWLNKQIYGVYKTGQAKSTLWRKKNKSISVKTAITVAQILHVTVDELFIDNTTAAPAPYPEIPEEIGTPRRSGSDTPAFEYTDPSRRVYEVKALVGHHKSDEEYIESVRWIFASGEHSTIQALKMNIDEFEEKIRFLKREKTINDSSGNPGNNAENA